MSEALERLNRHHRQLLHSRDVYAAALFVQGEGNGDHPPVMLVGEAPGAQEATEGRPFVGKAGRNLSQFLEVLGLEREEIYISNVVKFRPTKPGKSKRLSNRAPARREVLDFTAWLMEEVAAVQPRVLVTLGNTPLKVFAGESARIGAMHGTITTTVEGRRLFPLYHPAAVIYNRSLMDTYHRDLEILKQILAGIPASLD